jgi:RNA polymerase sigma-70 factor (ECF subfamily)
LHRTGEIVGVGAPDSIATGPPAATPGHPLAGATAPLPRAHDSYCLTVLIPTPEQAGDLELAQRARRRDQTAIVWLAGQLAAIPPILAARNRRANGMLDAGDLDDLGQEVAAIVWRRLETFRGEARLKTWIYQICHIEFANAARRLSRRHPPESLDDHAEPGAAAPEPTFLRHADLHDCLARLPDDARELLLAKHFDGKSLETLARERTTNLNTIKSRYTRALQRMRDCLRRKDPKP